MWGKTDSPKRLGEVDRLSYRILARICHQPLHTETDLPTYLFSKLVLLIDVFTLQIKVGQINGTVEETADLNIETGRHDSGDEC